MTTSSDTDSIVRASIEELLLDYIAAPLLNAREKDYQAVLFVRLRARIPTPVPATFEIGVGRPNTRHTWTDPRTSRVHIEMSFGTKGVTGESIKPDMIVLRDRPVVLRCSKDGPADLQETVCVDDVEAAIELKAAPSQNKDEAAKFARDVEKLARVQRASPALACFALVIDKSISLPSAVSKRVTLVDWLSLVTGLERRLERPSGPCVEVWFVDPTSVTPHRTYFTVSEPVSPQALSNL